MELAVPVVLAHAEIIPHLRRAFSDPEQLADLVVTTVSAVRNTSRARAREVIDGERGVVDVTVPRAEAGFIEVEADVPPLVVVARQRPVVFGRAEANARLSDVDWRKTIVDGGLLDVGTVRGLRDALALARLADGPLPPGTRVRCARAARGFDIGVARASVTSGVAGVAAVAAAGSAGWSASVVTGCA